MFSASTNFANDVQGTLCANNETNLILGILICILGYENVENSNRNLSSLQREGFKEIL